MALQPIWRKSHSRKLCRQNFLILCNNWESQCNCKASALKIEAICSSETLISTSQVQTALQRRRSISTRHFNLHYMLTKFWNRKVWLDRRQPNHTVTIFCLSLQSKKARLVRFKDSFRFEMVIMVGHVIITVITSISSCDAITWLISTTQQKTIRKGKVVTPKISEEILQHGNNTDANRDNMKQVLSTKEEY